MPSRQFLSSSPTALAPHSYVPPISSLHQSQYPSQRLAVPLLVSTASGCSLFLLILLCFRKLTGKHTTTSVDSDSKPPYRFPFSVLRRATSNFSNRLGHGGFGPVFSGTFPSTHQSIAVKFMDPTSLQGEQEFHNELFFASRLCSRYVVSAIGFCSDGKRRRFLLVYELMRNGNLQDALLTRKYSELMDWKKRFDVVVDIAKGIQYLHSCDPPVIHGDIKPSNILLDSNFCAKIADFGLARLKPETEFESGVLDVNGMGKTNGRLDSDVHNKKEAESNRGVGIEDCGSVVEETESVTTGFDDASVCVEQSPESFVRIPISETSPETIEVVTTSPETGTVAMASPSEGTFDWCTVERERVAKGGGKNENELKSGLGNNLRSKQDNGVALSGENKKVKDYVMQWIGTEISKEGPKRNWGASTSSSGTTPGNFDKKKEKKRLEWWISMDEERNSKNAKKEKRKSVREWWREEYTEELTRKKKKNKKQKQKIGIDMNDADDGWLVKDDDLYMERKKKRKSRSRGSRNSLDWWLEGLSGDLGRARWNSYDSANGEIPKSGGISSTPSTRGTVCYVAPECAYAGDVSEKCDVYSFGVLLLVIVSGRRPLHVSGSPISDFQRANLLSWTRHCARHGKLLELVDKSIQSLDKEQAVLCITVALLCLQKSSSRRPSMIEVVGMLTGDLQPPNLPIELSPSNPSYLSIKSRRKVR